MNYLKHGKNFKKLQWGSAMSLSARAQAPFLHIFTDIWIVGGAGCSLTFQVVHTQGWTSCIPLWSFYRTWSPLVSLDRGCFLLREQVSNMISASPVNPKMKQIRSTDLEGAYLKKRAPKAVSHKTRRHSQRCRRNWKYFQVPSTSQEDEPFQGRGNKLRQWT